MITRAELFAGNTATNLSAQLLAPFKKLNVDRAIAERVGRVAHEFGVRLPDALIAAIALEHRLGLVTRNTKKFASVRGLGVRALWRDARYHEPRTVARSSFDVRATVAT